MLPASNRGVGMNIGFPDVCLTPVGPAMVPIPYPNFAMHAMAVPFSPTVFITFMNALNMASKIPMTMGDEPGVGGPFIKMMGGFTMGHPLVWVSGLPAINLLCPTTGNNMNNPLGAVLVPAITTVFYTRAGAPPPGTVDLETMSHLGAALDDNEPVRGELLEGCVALLRVRLFTTDVGRTFHGALEALVGAGARALVIDLRGNPGGDLEAARSLADDFLERDAVIATLLDADGDEVVVRARRGDPLLPPVVLLVDGGTASAAELFALALQQNGRALVVGEPSFGKTTVQALVVGPGGDGVYANVARRVGPSRAVPDRAASKDGALAEATRAALELAG